jgi:AAA ATPase domain/Bacterial transcriptional activator domain
MAATVSHVRGDAEQARATARAAEAALAAGDAAAALERARAALALTGRPPLPGWADQLRCEALETAARSALALGEPASAEQLARALIELEPYRESGYGLLMEALARGGDVAEALLTFDRVRALLRDELGVSPAPALTALRERLLGRPAPAPAARGFALPPPAAVRRSGRSPFVAREAELRRLRARWQQARGGQGALVLVTGEPGIGKTRLAARFAAEAHAAGALVLYGRADEEAGVPYQPFPQALRPLTAHVDAPALGPLLFEPDGSAEDGRSALFETAAALLERVAPVLLVLDDVHFAGTPALLLVRELVRRAAPIMVLATCDDTERAPLRCLLADVRRDGALECISLAGPGPGPEVLRRRLERLAPETLEVLTCAAVLGREFSLGALVLLAGGPADQVLAALEQAADAGLIGADADGFSFSHGLVRDALYHRPTAARRRLLHLRAGTALEQARARLDVRAAELAHHFTLARDGERAARYALEAGAEAMRAYAFEDAARHCERALEALPGHDDAARAEAWLALGSALRQGGEPGARAAFDAAAEIAERRGDAALLARAVLGAGGGFYAPRRVDAAHVARLERALARADGIDTRGRLLSRLAETLPDGARRVQVSAEATALARAGGEPAALATALLGRHAAHLHAEHLELRRGLAEEAVAVADAAALREAGALARHWLIHDLVEAAELDAARARHEELCALAAGLPEPLLRHSALAWRAVFAQLAGRGEQAERLAREGLRLGERAGVPSARAHFTAQLAAIRRPQGRLPELLGVLERLAAQRSETMAWAALLPLAHLDAGDAVAAGDAFAAALAAVPGGLLWLPATAWLAEAAAALGRTDASAALREQLEPYAGRLVQASFTGCWGGVDRLLA